MADTYQLTLKIKRYDPDSRRSWVQEYSLAAGRILRFVDVFRKLNDELDPTLAWSSSCEHAQCGTCSVRINGKPLLACELLVENAVAHWNTTTFLVEPIAAAPVVRDLVVDMEQAYKRVEKVQPFIINPAPIKKTAGEYEVAPAEMAPYLDATRCVNCFCCADACISSSKSFLGPNAVMAGVVRLLDKREQDRAIRLDLIYSEEGVYRCHSSRACSSVCPKEIDVAHYMALAKEGRFDKA